MSQGTEFATQYAEYYGFDAQGEDESDHEFRSRVASQLRDMGKVVEAREAFRDEHYKQSDNVMTGVFGAAAQALHGDSGRSGEQQLGDDVVTGTVLGNPRKGLPEETQIKERSDFEDI